MRKLRCAVVAFSMLAISAGVAHGQRFGAQVNWADDADLGLGARVELPIALASEGALAGTFLIGSFDYFFPDGYDYFEFNGNVGVPVSPQSALNPYVGAGLNMARASAEVDVPGVDASNTELGLNALGGIRFGIGTLSSFAEARLELSGGEQLVLTFGILFGGSR
jgi:opacity protein-like surface antigen